MTTLTIVDDDQGLRTAPARLLQGLGHAVTVFASADTPSISKPFDETALLAAIDAAMSSPAAPCPRHA